jgi:hypothetical protein
MGVEYKGSRLQWRKDADPYQMKLVNARIKARRRSRQKQHQKEMQ